ncbi:restriction endonuclease [Nocardia tengchongensis]|uniref:restriction endonuclease n=1 Tax=Nocardia tengchongensis TaxID=2055889 RepID=UPI0036942C71
MSKVPLTPMLVQYLTALCCLRCNPDAVDITIGEMVEDEAAESTRDVDVTVTIKDSDSVTDAFMAYEVKHERSALDVAKVEALCLKLNDMPSITHRVIVSTSGFSPTAQKKAARHGVELYQLKEWTRPLQEQFPLLEMTGTVSERFPRQKWLLTWNDYRFALVSSAAQGPFAVESKGQALDQHGKPHGKYSSFEDFWNELLLRSTEVLYCLEPADTVLRTFPLTPSDAPGEPPAAGPQWPHTHTLDVSADGVYFTNSDTFCRIDTVTINGFLRWERSRTPPAYVIERLSDGQAFAGALVSPGERPGQMIAFVFSPTSRDIGIEFVQLSEAHQNAIRQLKLEYKAGSVWT